MIGWLSMLTNPPREAGYYLTRDNKGVLKYAFYVGYWEDDYHRLQNVVAWATTKPDKHELIKARRTRKNNSWFNVVKENK